MAGRASTAADRQRATATGLPLSPAHRRPSRRSPSSGHAAEAGRFAVIRDTAQSNVGFRDQRTGLDHPERPPSFLQSSHSESRWARQQDRRHLGQVVAG